jgi:hypothetical protein
MDQRQSSRGSKYYKFTKTCNLCDARENLGPNPYSEDPDLMCLEDKKNTYFKK